jgi:hypothetical protein
MPLPVPGPSWTLFPNGLLAFIRPAQGDKPERLLLSRVDFCTTKGCMCRDVGLRSLEYDVAAFRAAPPEDLATRLARGSALESRIDLDFGTVSPDDFEGRVALTAEWLSFLRDEVDGQLLDTLHGKWLEAKGAQQRPPDFTAHDSEPGLFIGWQRSQPQLRDDSFLVDGRSFVADELYCLAPGCDCDQAVVDFIELLSGDDVEPIGGIRVRVTDAHVLHPDVEPGNELLVERLWSAYQQRHRGLAHLVRHQRFLLDARRADRAARASPRKARAARNEPCPCGSGQKYKRCCMERDLAASSQR